MHCIISFSFNNARVLYVFARKTFNLIDFDAVFFKELEKIFRSGCQEVARNRKSFCKKQCQTKQGLYFGTSIIFYLARALTKWGQINFESAFTFYFIESKVKTALQQTVAKKISNQIEWQWFPPQMKFEIQERLKKKKKGRSYNIGGWST